MTDSCSADQDPLESEELRSYVEQLGNGWNVVEEHHLEKEYEFDDFKSALDFTNRVGEIAEDMGHHPDILLSYGKVKVTVWTHKIGGLADTDFIFAERVEKASS
jgi:4a-hydroxytetrahydrobiopterin dehydratase